jgi:hypothetical protein
LAYKRISPGPVVEGYTGNNTFTAYSIICAGTTSTGAFQNVSGVGTSGQFLQSQGAAALPQWVTDPGASGASTFHTDSGTANASSNTITLHGGSNIATSGSAATVTINVSGTTNHSVQIGNAGGSLTSVSVGATNTVLLGNTAADPSFGTVPNAALTNSSVTLSSGNNITVTGGGPLSLGGTASFNVTGTTNHNVQIGNASGSLTSVAPSATSGVPLISQGASADPVFGTAVVAGGGTGNTTFTAYSVICAGTTATGVFQNVSGVGSSGNILTSNGAGALPSWQAPAASSISLTGDSGGALTGAAFTLAGGTGISTSGAGSTITITNTATALAWSVITANQSAVVNNGYIANKAGTLVLTLPTTAAAGTLIEVTGMNTALGWQIAQNANQIIHIGTSNTTTGVTGTLTSSATRDSVKLVCVVANLEWNVTSVVGNITVV